MLHVLTVWSQHSRIVSPAGHVPASVCESGLFFEWHCVTLGGWVRFVGGGGWWVGGGGSEGDNFD